MYPKVYQGCISIRSTVIAQEKPMSLLSNTRFLAIYSGVVTLTFAATVVFGLSHSSVLAATNKPVTFDQITVHRINVVEPNGKTRLVIADNAEFPGGFFYGKETSRPSRAGTAGMLFMNDEGTENGGLIFGGYKKPDGSFYSYGHLSFDEYEQDQALSEDMQQDGAERSSAYEVSDNGTGLITPEALDAFNKVQAMPTDTPGQQAAAKKAKEELFQKYPIKLTHRAYLGREPDRSSSLHLKDAQGHDRILLRVTAEGTPTMQFLDANGKVIQQWPQP
jgi:hypothetical protein